MYGCRGGGVEGLKEHRLFPGDLALDRIADTRAALPRDLPFDPLPACTCTCTSELGGAGALGDGDGDGDGDGQFKVQTRAKRIDRSPAPIDVTADGPRAGLRRGRAGRAVRLGRRRGGRAGDGYRSSAATTDRTPGGPASGADWAFGPAPARPTRGPAPQATASTWSAARPARLRRNPCPSERQAVRTRERHPPIKATAPARSRARSVSAGGCNRSGSRHSR